VTKVPMRNDQSSYLSSCPQVLRPHTSVFKGTLLEVLVYWLLYDIEFLSIAVEWPNQAGNHGSIVLVIAFAFGHIARQAMLFPQVNEISQALIIQICSRMGDRDMINHQIHKVHHPQGATESWDNTAPHLIDLRCLYLEMSRIPA